MEPRKLTKADLDKVREIEGFPIGKDEDIIELSDAPYYTACPNPFIEEFIKENGTPYVESTDDYHCEPFSSDMSEGKYDPIYKLHPYHTKVPHKAIMKYILHYTNPGDIVFDGFCGTGMAGVAAQLCGENDEALKHEMLSQVKGASWGERVAIINDLSPAATYISWNYNTPISDISAFASEAERIMQECQNECSWMYETNHKETTFNHEAKGKINYVVWSDVFLCPHCGKELVFWDVAVDVEKGKIKDFFLCDSCGSKLKKTECERAKTVEYDDGLETLCEFSKQAPVRINYSYGKKRYEKRPDEDDYKTLEKISAFRTSYQYPTDELPIGYNTEQPKRSHGLSNVHHFYTKRNLITLASFYNKIKMNSPIGFALTKVASHLTKQYRLTYMSGCWGAGGGPMSGTLYIPSLVKELNMLDFIEDAIKIQYRRQFKKGKTCITTQSTTSMVQMPDNSIDYIFTDPPFGQNLMYSELNYIWEAWLKVKTNNDSEAIMNSVQNKGLLEYQFLMTKCFEEYCRVLKPGRWITIEFHNSKNAVWNAIQEGLVRAGFVIADIRTLDKQHNSFKQVVSSVTIKQDLIISAYKPKLSLKRSLIANAGHEDTAWAFVREHLSNVPVVVNNNGAIEIIRERQAFLLWDRMVAYHITNGISVPIDATDFYMGLDDRFMKRDEMYFLPNQVNEYDMTRSTCEVENVQLSLIVSDEKTAIGWLYQQLSIPQKYSQIMPNFMQELNSVNKYEKMPELSVILEENFIKNDNDEWYVPDLTKAGDVAKLREKNLLKEFQDYLRTKGKLKVFRSEAVRAGFARLWKDKDYKTIVDVAERLPEQTIQEDPNLLMYYDISLSRV